MAKNDETLKTIITVVASSALIISLVAAILNRDSQFSTVATVFGSVAAFAFGGHLFSKIEK